jgi:ssDNA-binding Zn-finger/Zn-ribbon topoisomerase 1
MAWRAVINFARLRRASRSAAGRRVSFLPFSLVVTPLIHWPLLLHTRRLDLGRYRRQIQVKAGIEPEEYRSSCAGSSAGVFTPIEVETPCPKCGKKMILKSGRFGFFLSCPDYPRCRESLPPSSGVQCPMPDCDGHVVEIKLKKGGKGRGKRTFYGCSNYGDNGCKFTIWDTPVRRKCSQCGHEGMVLKREKGGAQLVCLNDACKHSEEIPL